MRKMKKAWVRGFTLIELTVTVAVMAILAGIAAPYFRDFVLANQLSRYTNDLVQASHAARIEAIKRTLPIRISAIDSSSGANEWGPGLVVYLDADNSSTFNAGDERIRTLSAVQGKQTIDGPDGLTGFRFLASGGLDIADIASQIVIDPADLESPLINLQICDNRAGETGRTISITRRGQVKTSDSSCG